MYNYTNLWYKITFLIALFLPFGCKKSSNQEYYDVEKHSISNIKFGSYFSIIDSVVICSKAINSPVFWYERKNGDLIIGNYKDGKVWVKKKDKCISIDEINKNTTNFISMAHPIAVAFNKENKMFIADNTKRRILVYDSLYKQLGSFILSGSHMTPVSMSIVGDKLFTGVFNKQNETLMQVYNTNGFFAKSIMSSDDSNKEHYNHSWETLNYVHSTSNENHVFGIQTTNYFVHKFDSTGSLTKKILLKPDYFMPLTDSLRGSSEDFFYVKENYCSPFNLSLHNGLLFIQTKCPKNKKNKYKLDIIEPTQMKIKYAGIDCDNQELISNDFRNPYISFLVRNQKANCFIIKRYKIK